MKIVATSDWHGDWVTHGVRRFPEVEEAVHATVDRAIEEEADAYAFLGDLCNPDAGSTAFRVVRLAIEAAVRLRERGIMSLWIAGNHDVIEDGSGETTLTPLRGLAFDPGPPIYVFEKPGAATIFGRKGGLPTTFFALPYPATAKNYDPAAVIAAELAPGAAARTVVLSHLTEIVGVEPGEETTEMPRGRGIPLPVDVLRDRCSLILNGHFHRQQRVGPVWIPGSLARLTFCEERHSPGYLVVET